MSIVQFPWVLSNCTRLCPTMLDYSSCIGQIWLSYEYDQLLWNATNCVGIRLITLEYDQLRYQLYWNMVKFEEMTPRTTFWLIGPLDSEASRGQKLSDIILSNCIGICPTALENVLLRWNTVQDESVQLCWNLFNNVGILWKFHKLLTAWTTFRLIGPR